MLAHAALPLIRTQENRPSQEAGWTARGLVGATFYIDSISSFRRRADLSVRIPRCALHRSPSFPFPVSRPLPCPPLTGPVIPYVWHAASSSSERDEALVARLVFGADHSPLSLRIWPCLGTARGERYNNTWSMAGFSDPAIRIRAAHEEKSPV